MSVRPVRWNVRPVVFLAGLLPEESADRTCWQVEIEPIADLPLGQRWSLDISNVDGSLQPLTVLCGERLMEYEDGSVGDLLSIFGYSPQKGTRYELHPGKVNMVYIDPVNRTYWVEGKQ